MCHLRSRRQQHWVVHMNSTGEHGRPWRHQMYLLTKTRRVKAFVHWVRLKPCVLSIRCAHRLWNFCLSIKFLEQVRFSASLGIHQASFDSCSSKKQLRKCGGKTHLQHDRNRLHSILSFPTLQAVRRSKGRNVSFNCVSYCEFSQHTQQSQLDSVCKVCGRSAFFGWWIK